MNSSQEFDRLPQEEKKSQTPDEEPLTDITPQKKDFQFIGNIKELNQRTTAKKSE